MNRSATQIMMVFGLLMLSACSKTAPDSKALIGKSAAAVDQSVPDLPDFVTYDITIDPKEITKKTGSPCGMNICVFQAYPQEAPLKKYDGSELCVLPEYESQAVLQGYFDKDGKLIGMNCTISRESYDAITDQYRSQAFNKYLNQRDVFEDFRTYQTKTGFITTYAEVMGRTPNGDVKYRYHVYVGPKQHPHYSNYVAN